MIRRLLPLLSSVVFFSGCVTHPVAKISPDEKIALISAIDPAMQGLKITFTIFGYKTWLEETPGFDVNAFTLNAAKAILNRDAKLVNGNDVGLLLETERDDNLSNNWSPPELMQKLTALGQKWQVDRIVLFQTAVAKDWFYGTMNLFDGFGQTSQSEKGPAMIYGIFWMRVFDCRTEQFVNYGNWANQARPVPGVHWHDSWNDYTSEEKQAITRELETLIKQSMPILLAKTGLTDVVSDRRPQDWRP